MSDIPGSSFDITAGDGNDTINISLQLYSEKLKLSGEWDGGSGEDTFYIGNTYGGILDLSGVTISGFEKITTGGSQTTLLVTESQSNNIDITGDGNYLSDEGTIQGTVEDDTFSGDGTDFFNGAAGNDSANFISTAVFSDVRNNYTVTRDQNNPEVVTVEHSGGTLLDGKDTITNALWLAFADDPAAGPTYQLDDHHRDVTASTRTLSYEEVFTAVAQYRTDRDTILLMSRLIHRSISTTAPMEELGIQFSDYLTGQQLDVVHQQGLYI